MPDRRTGHEILTVLDNHHAEIGARLSLFHDRVYTRAAEIDLHALLDEVNDLIVTHFRVEETAMSDLRYAKFWAHRDEHYVIWMVLLRLTDECYKNHFMPDSGARLCNTLDDLLHRHDENFDKPLMKYVKSRVSR